MKRNTIITIALGGIYGVVMSVIGSDYTTPQFWIGIGYGFTMHLAGLSE